MLFNVFSILNENIIIFSNKTIHIYQVVLDVHDAITINIAIVIIRGLDL